MNFRTVNRFLSYVNELTDIVVIRLGEEDDRRILFITELKYDFFVKI